MPNVTLPNGRKHYVNPFCIRCDRCERLESSDWISERCRYECSNCQRDWESEHEQDEVQDAFQIAAE